MVYGFEIQINLDHFYNYIAMQQNFYIDQRCNEIKIYDRETT